MKKYLLSLVAAVLLIPTLGLAADVRTAEVVTKEETPKNLYLAGENPTVDANVLGDLVVAGGTVTVNGNVEHGVLAAGGTLVLNGTVGQSVRVAGGTVTVESSIGGDLIVFGGDVILGTKSVVAGDVIVMGGTVALKGKVLGDVQHSYAGDVTISGSIAGNVELSNVGTLKLEPTAVIGGNLKYTSQTEAVVSSDAKVGGKVEFTKAAPAQMKGPNASQKLGGILFGALMAFVTLLVFINLFPRFAVKTVAESTVNPWSKMGIGFLAIVVTPIALLLLLITFIGWGVMGYLFMAYMAFFALTGTVSALLAGSVLWKYLSKSETLDLDWKTAGLGVIILAALKAIPVVGWVGGFLIALIVFGTLTSMGLEYIKAQRA